MRLNNFLFLKGVDEAQDVLILRRGTMRLSSFLFLIFSRFSAQSMFLKMFLFFLTFRASCSYKKKKVYTKSIPWQMPKLCTLIEPQLLVTGWGPLSEWIKKIWQRKNEPPRLISSLVSTKWQRIPIQIYKSDDSAFDIIWL